MAPLHILVADEDTDTRIILRALLERQGYSISEAATAQQAMTSVTADIDLIIMNHPMMATPQVSLARWFRAQAETREIPIINLTSRAVPNFMEDAAKQGVTVSLVKPLDVHRVLELVRQLTTQISAV